MARHTQLKKHGYAPRDEVLLVRQSVLDPEDPGSFPFVPYDVNAPGLYPDEKVVKMEDGEHVAVSVEPEWLANGAGVALHAFARWLEPDGSTKIAPGGAPIEVSHSATFYHGFLEVHPIEELRDEVEKIVLGDEPKMVDVFVDSDVVAGKKPMLPQEIVDELTAARDDHTIRKLEPARAKRPVIDINPEHAHASNIAKAIEHVKKLEKL